MSKTAVVYWSGTGNTEAMAAAVADGVKAAGGEATLFTAAEFTADAVDSFDAIAFGCPAMGAEVLEEDEFAPMFESCESKLKGKKIALFGSYGWGDGEWRRNWEERVISAGGKLINGAGLMANEAPDDEALANCKALGAKAAAL